jgi:hypothetical protein
MDPARVAVEPTYRASRPATRERAVAEVSGIQINS